MAATCPVVEGFEHGVTANGTGGNLYQAVSGTPSIVASHRGAGARAMRFAPGAGGTTTVAFDLPTASATLVVVAYVYFNAVTVLGTTARTIFNIQDAGATIASLQVRQSGGVNNYRCRGSGAGSIIDGATFVAGQVYRVEMRTTIAAGTVTTDWKIDGTGQTQSVDTTASTTMSRVRLGATLSGTDNIAVDWDDIGISTTSGDYPIGDIEVVSLAPSTLDIAGSTSPTKFNTDSGIDPVAGDSSLLADAPITGGLTTYIGQDTADVAANIEVEFADPVGTPLGASVSGAMLNDGSGNSSFSARGRSNGGTETSMIAATVNPTAAGAYVRAFLPIPAGGWTAAELSAYVVRFGYANDVTPNPRWSAFTLSYARAPLTPTGTGQVTAPAGVLAGTGTVKVVGTAATTAPAALLAGAGTVKVTGQGALTAPAALLAGAGTVVSPITGTGALTAPAALVAGQADVDVAGTGSLTTPAGLLAGQGTVAWPAISGVGALVAPAGLVSGQGKAIVIATGQLVAPAGVLLGSLNPLPVGVNVRLRVAAEVVRMRLQAETTRMRVDARGDGIKVRP